MIGLIGSTFGNSVLQNISLNPDEAAYSKKTAAVLRALGVNINTDPYFAMNSTEDGHLRTQQGGFDLRKLKQLKLLVSFKMSQELKDKAGTSGSGFGLYC